MSADNVETVRRLMAAFNDRDVDGMAAELSEDAEFYPLRAQLEGKAYVGLVGVRDARVPLALPRRQGRLHAELLRVPVPLRR